MFRCLLPLCIVASMLAAEKPRLLVLTDSSNEPDGEQSLVRLLVYSNEYDIEGLIATHPCGCATRRGPI